MSTQSVITRRWGPRSRHDRQYRHVNMLRTGPCRIGRHDYRPTRDPFTARCLRCDAEAPIMHPRARCIVALDPAAPDQPPLIATPLPSGRLSWRRVFGPTTDELLRDWFDRARADHPNPAINIHPHGGIPG